MSDTYSEADLYHPLERGSEHYAPGPVFSANELAEMFGALVQRINFLIERMNRPMARQPVSGNTTAQLDGSGNNQPFLVYSVAPGTLFELTNITAEIATFDATNPRTPAAPYSNADFWLGLFVSGSPDSVAQGQLIDFTPTTDGAQGIPNVASYSPPHLIRGGEHLLCYVATGPASQRLSIRYEGWTSQL